MAFLSDLTFQGPEIHQTPLKSTDSLKKEIACYCTGTEPATLDSLIQSSIFLFETKVSVLTIRLLCSLPGQTAMLQNLVCFSGPSQGSPPN